MKTPAWIAGSLLMLVMAQTAQAEQERVVQEAQNGASARLTKRPAGDEAQPRRDKLQQPKRERLSPEERLKLRRDINEAGRDIYRVTGAHRQDNSE